jgi:hypothetical protein
MSRFTLRTAAAADPTASSTAAVPAPAHAADDDPDPSPLNLAGETVEPRSERRRARVVAVLVTTSAGTYWDRPVASRARVPRGR